MNKKNVVAATVGSLAFAAILGAGAIYAQGGNLQTNDLPQLIAQKFNLNQDEVQTVFDQYREQRREQRQQENQQRMEENLNQAVADGKITESQKQLILQKHQEMQAERESETFDPGQGRENARKHHDEMEQWAKDNGIDLESVIGDRPMMRDGEFGGRHGMMRGRQ